MKAIGPVLVIVVGALSAILLTYFVCDIATDTSAGIAVAITSVTSLRAAASTFDTTEQHVDPSDAPPATFGARDLTVGAGGSMEGEVPIEEYYLPLKEKDTLATLDAINSAASSPIVSITSIAISSDNTIIWYDHHEDGFENDLLNPSPSSSTEIWGDGDCSNGSVPGATCVADTDDFLSAGTAIVLEEEVPIPYTSQQWSFFCLTEGTRFLPHFPSLSPEAVILTTAVGLCSLCMPGRSRCWTYRPTVTEMNSSRRLVALVLIRQTAPFSSQICM
jgi:hypothetical protein